MKNHLFLIIFFISILACNQDNGGIEIGEDYEINFQESATFDNGNLEISFVEVVEDSRCPSTIDCVWEGRAWVRMNITEIDIVGSIDLITENSINRDSMLTAEFGDFLIELKEVKPYPEGVISSFDNYSVVININEL